MANLLALVNTVRMEAGVASSDLPTVQGALSLESARFLSWVRREWLALANQKTDWQFLRQTNQFTTTANKYLYSLTDIGAASQTAFTPSQFQNWKVDSFRVSSAPNYGDEMLAAFMPWDAFRNVYVYGQMRSTTSRPVSFTVAPDKSIGLGMTPDGVYTVVYEYYMAPPPLVLDTDIPPLPQQFHDLIVYRAVNAYATFMDAPEVAVRATSEIARLYPELLSDQLPVPGLGAPLA